MSDGCGKEYACAPGRRRLFTTGEKAPDCADELDGIRRCGPWSVQRDFYVTLPTGYDPQKPYGLMIHGGGCGSLAYESASFVNGAADSLIRVGVAPGPDSTGQPAGFYGCFDDYEGDDSIDWVFYERLYDKLNAELCFDRRRVFVSAHANGFGNELGCKYAGDTVRAVRGVLVDSGWFPAQPQYLPTCSQAPLAGMWVNEVASLTNPFDGDKRAITRAMGLGQCLGGDYDHAKLEDFPIGGGNADDVCQRIVGCDPLYPLVVCPLPSPQRGRLDSVDNPGFLTFIKLFDKPPLVPSP
jgi:hypothetical protein